jgi:hypothetical protein
MASDTEGGRWLTYSELAATRAIKRATAIRLARKHRWRRQAGNDGQARVVFVPVAMMQPDERHHGSSP